MESWGRHMVLCLDGCSEFKITDGDSIKRWSELLIQDIDMTAYGDPILVDFAHENDKTGGYTFVQLIETSNIMAHFANKPGQAYIDVFSCKDFDIDLAVKMTVRFFEARKYKFKNLERGDWHNTADTYKVVDPVIQHLCGSMGKVA